MSYKVLWLEDDINQILEAFQSLQSRGLHVTHVAKVSDAVNEVYHRHHDLDLGPVKI